MLERWICCLALWTLSISAVSRTAWAEERPNGTPNRAA